MLWQMLSSFQLYAWTTKGGGTLYFKIEPSIWGASMVSFFFGVMGQSNWLIVNKQKKLNLGNTARNQ
jgi:hypothetical protein